MSSKHWNKKQKEILEESRAAIENFILYDNMTLNSLLNQIPTISYNSLCYKQDFVTISIDKNLELEIKYRNKLTESMRGSLLKSSARLSRMSLTRMSRLSRLSIKSLKSSFKPEETKTENEPNISFIDELVEEVEIEDDNNDEKCLDAPLDYLTKIIILNPKKQSRVQLPMDKYNKEKIIEINMFPNPGKLKTDQEISVVKANAEGSKIYLGSSNGKIFRINNLSKDKKLEELKSPFENHPESISGISAIDIKDDNLVAGYLNGMIAFWNNKEKLISQNNSTFKEGILSLKILKTKKDKIKVLASSQEGKVCIVKNSQFKKQISLITTLNQYFLVEVMEVNLIENEKIEKKHGHIRNLSNALGTINPLRKKDNMIPNKVYFLVSLEEILAIPISHKQKKPEITNIMPNLDFKHKDEVADIAIGKGYVPFSTESMLDSIKKAQQDPDIRDDFFNNESLAKLIQENELEIALVCKGSYIYMLVPLIQNADNGLKLFIFGKYYHYKKIYKVGFISNSFIFLIDEELRFKVIHTFYFEQFTQTNRENVVCTELQMPVIIKDLNLRELKLTFKILNPSDRRKLKECYSNSVSSYNKGVVLNGNKQSFWLVTPCELKDCINAEIADQRWEKLLNLVYSFVSQQFPLLPLYSSTSNLKEINENVLNKSVSFAIMNEKSAVNQEKIIKTIIDFSIRLKITDTLFSALHTICVGKIKFLDIFFKTLSEFILLNHFKENEQCKSDIIVELIHYHCPSINKRNSIVKDKDKNTKKDDITKLTKVLLHLNDKTLNNKEITQILNDFNFIFVNLYIKMNSSKPAQETFKFLDSLFVKFQGKQNHPSYNKFILEQKSQELTFEICASKQYFGHSILWIINFIFKGEIYPDRNIMSNDIFSEIIYLIFYWMGSRRVSKEFLLFDSYSFFEVISKFYIEENLYNKIKKEHSKLKSFLSNYIDTSESFTPKGILNNLIKNCIELTNNFYIMHDLNVFIIKIQSKNLKYIEVDQQLIFDACVSLLQSSNLKDENAVDNFNLHSNVYNGFIEKRIEDEKALFNIITKLQKTLPLEKRNKLYSSIINSKMHYIKIRYFEENEDFDQCFLSYLEFYSNIDNFAQSTLVPEIIYIFEWINKTVNKLFSTKITEALCLLESIAQKSIELAEISKEDFYILFNRYYKDQSDLIINGLAENISLQLDFLLTLIDDLKNDKFLLERLNTQTYNENGEISEDENSSLSKLDFIYITIITNKCKLKQTDDLLLYVKEKPYLCNESLLKLFKEVGEIRCVLFAYKCIGNYEDGIKFGLKAISDTIGEINAMFSDEKEKKTFDTQKFESLTKQEKEFLKLTLELIKGIDYILVNLWNQEDLKRKDPWYLILDLLYQEKQSFYKTYIVNYSTKWRSIRRGNEYHIRYRFLNEAIEMIIKAMAKYASLTVIIEKVTENFSFVGFIEFKRIILKHIKKSVLEETMLYSLRSISNVESFHFYEKLLKTSNEGKLVILNNCSFCYKKLKDLDFIEEDLLYFFVCGHKYHSFCCATENKEYICRICRKQQIERYIEMGAELTLPDKKNDSEYEKMKKENAKEISNENNQKRNYKKGKLKAINNKDRKRHDYLIDYSSDKIQGYYYEYNENFVPKPHPNPKMQMQQQTFNTISNKNLKEDRFNRKTNKIRETTISKASYGMNRLSITEIEKITNYLAKKIDEQIHQVIYLRELMKDTSYIEVIYRQIRYYSLLRNVFLAGAQNLKKSYESDCIEDKLLFINDFEKQFFEQFWNYFKDIETLAVKNPDLLNQLINIIDNEPQYFQNVKEKINSDLHLQKAINSSILMSLEDESTKHSEEFRDKFQIFVKERIEKQFKGKIKQQDVLNETIKVANHLNEIKTKIVPLFPPHFNIFRMYQTEYLDNIRIIVKPFLKREEIKKSPGKLNTIGHWLEEFDGVLRKSGIDIEQSEMSIEVKNLMRMFYDHVNDMLDDDLNPIIEKNKNDKNKIREEKKKDLEKIQSFYATDVYNSINGVIQRLSMEFKGILLNQIVRACFEKIKKLIIISKDEIEKFQSPNDFIVSMVYIQDATKCLESFKTFKKKVKLLLLPELYEKLIKEYKAVLIGMYNDNIQRGCNKAVKLMLGILRKLYLSKMFTKEWNDDVLISTFGLFKNYFNTGFAKMIKEQNDLISIVRIFLDLFINYYLEEIIHSVRSFNSDAVNAQKGSFLAKYKLKWININSEEINDQMKENSKNNEEDNNDNISERSKSINVKDKKINFPVKNFKKGDLIYNKTNILEMIFHDKGLFSDFLKGFLENSEERFSKYLNENLGENYISNFINKFSLMTMVMNCSYNELRDQIPEFKYTFNEDIRKALFEALLYLRKDEEIATKSNNMQNIMTNFNL